MTAADDELPPSRFDIAPAAPAGPPQGDAKPAASVDVRRAAGPRDAGRPVEGRPAADRRFDGSPRDRPPFDGRPPDGRRFDGPPSGRRPLDGRPPDGRRFDGSPRGGRSFDGRPPEGRRFDGPPRDDRPPQSRAAIADDLLIGEHAVEALVRLRPERVRELHIWDAHPRTAARLRELATAGDVRVLPTMPQGLPPGPSQGVAARILPFPYVELDAVVPIRGAVPGTLIVVLDSVTDAHNVGAILRSAAFFGATALVLPQDRAAEITPTVERIAEGGSAIVPVVRVVNLARTLQDLAARDVEVVGTVLDGAQGDLRTWRWGRAAAIVLGAEGNGLRPLVRKRCDVLLTLPAVGPMQSLNVSVFAGLALSAVRAAMPPPAAPELASVPPESAAEP
ncbi:MAG: hypothetical protein EXR79_08285 [Myxococcales bacterium]|nr:hypothetical protein [Myxococcales bacterium]